MSMRFSDNPVEDDGTYGGYARLARHCSELNPARPEGPYTRQAVNGWYLRRESNGFPERVEVLAKTGKVKQWFRISDVDTWYRENRKTSAASDAEREMTEPMFPVDGQGNPVR